MSKINDNDMKAMDKIVGQKIRIRRVKQGLTQQDLAAALGLSYQQVQKYETGANRVSAGRLYYIANVLGVDIPYFFSAATEEEQMSITPRARQRDRLADLDGITPVVKSALSNLVNALR